MLPNRRKNKYASRGKKQATLKGMKELFERQRQLQYSPEVVYISDEEQESTVTTDISDKKCISSYNHTIADTSDHNLTTESFFKVSCRTVGVDIVTQMENQNLQPVQANNLLRDKKRLQLKRKVPTNHTVSIHQRDGTNGNAICTHENISNQCEKGICNQGKYIDNALIEDDCITTGDQVPYYLENFKLILDSVLSRAEDKKLFNSEDLDIIRKFYSLSDESQKLYVRLFQRKHKWIPCHKINYPDICDDLSPMFQQLMNNNFIMNELELTDLHEVLCLLPAIDIRSLAKSLHVNTHRLSKSALIQAVIKMSKQQPIASYFNKKPASSVQLIVVKAKSFLKQCYCVTKTHCSVLMRVLLLFSLTTSSATDLCENRQQIFRMLLVNVGEMVYPTYLVLRQSAVFEGRQDVLWLEKALFLAVDVSQALERNQYDKGFNLYIEAKKLWTQLEADKLLRSFRHDAHLPVFLRCYTASSVLVRILFNGVEILQKQRNYAEAVEQLQQLLDQNMYLQDCRGRWYDRLALNLEQHLKQPEKALDVIKSALEDTFVQGGHRLSLYQRAMRICNSPSTQKLNLRQHEFAHYTVQAIPEVTIDGQTLPREIPGYKTVFISQLPDATNDDIALCSVEEVALQFYKVQEGYTYGIHGEGSTFLTLFGLLFWDVIYFPGVPDTFYCPYQTAPLDLYSENFYNGRKEVICERLKVIEESSVQELHDQVARIWTEQKDTMCSVINWSRFNSLEHVQSLITCMKGSFLRAVCSKFCKELRHWHSGMPDLVVWNTESETFKISEVKGPGDRLSTKQTLWLDYFMSLGACVEVCHVKATGSKKLKRSKDT